MNATNNGSISYGYDVVGNRLQRTSSVPAIANQTSTFDANDRLNSDSYDANGNTKTSNGNTYAYDFDNRLTSLNNGAIRFIYDGDGNRVGKTVSGVTTNYLVDTNNPTGYAQVVEELVSGAVVKQYTFGHDLISQRQLIASNWTTSFYGYDGHGSVRLLINTSGVVTDTFDFDAFGFLVNRTGTTPNDYLYTGEQFDANLGFYYLRARYMNPSNGRFQSMDSFEGTVNDPRSLHKYLYTSNNPINNIDPSGHFSISYMAVGIAVGAILLSIGGYFLYKAITQKLPRSISINWQVAEWTMFDQRTHTTHSLTYTEIQDIKNIATNVAQQAFLGFAVTVREGTGGNQMIVRDRLMCECSGSTVFGSNTSTIYYDPIKLVAARFAEDRGITSRADIINGIGRAIGNTIPHEFAHQLNLHIDTKIDRNSFDWHGFDRWEQFYGGDFRWTQFARNKLETVLPTTN